MKESKATGGNALLGYSLRVCPVHDPDTASNAIEVIGEVTVVDAALAGIDDPVLNEAVVENAGCPHGPHVASVEVITSDPEIGETREASLQKCRRRSRGET